MEVMLSLKNKVILITGGYGYLGTSICQGLVLMGAKVWVLGKSAEKFSHKFGQTSNMFFQEVDISDTKSIENGIEKIYQIEQKIDVFINNAMFLKGQHPETMSDEDWNYGIDGCLNSVYRCIRAVIPYLKKNSVGKIINVSSMYGLVSPDFKVYENNTFLNPPHYGASKAGILQMTRYYACYLGKHNIQVNAVTPGAFPNTEVQQNQEFIQNLKEKSPLGKIGKPEDLQGVFILLSSEASNFITGQNFIIDGGWTAW